VCVVHLRRQHETESNRYANELTHTSLAFSKLLRRADRTFENVRRVASLKARSVTCPPARRDTKRISSDGQCADLESRGTLIAEHWAGVRSLLFRFELMVEQLIWLFVLSLPVACVSWTITHEELFREPRNWLEQQSRTAFAWWQRKVCYMLTCEYCFSHYVAAAFVALMNYRLLLDDWRGYLVAWLALVAIANTYLSAYSRLRVEIRQSRAEADTAEAQVLR
jgi:hypothetical protein